MPSFAKTLRRWYWTVLGAEEQAGADLGVRQAVAGQPGDLGLLGGESAAVGTDARGGRSRRWPAAPPGPIGEAAMPMDVEHVVGRPQLLARVHAPPFAAQPLAVEQVRAGELDPHAGAPQAVDRLAVQASACSPSPSSAASAPAPPAPSRCRWRRSSR